MKYHYSYICSSMLVLLMLSFSGALNCKGSHTSVSGSPTGDWSACSNPYDPGVEDELIIEGNEEAFGVVFAAVECRNGNEAFGGGVFHVKKLVIRNGIVSHVYDFNSCNSVGGSPDSCGDCETWKWDVWTKKSGEVGNSCGDGGDRESDMLDACCVEIVSENNLNVLQVRLLDDPLQVPFDVDKVFLEVYPKFISASPGDTIEAEVHVRKVSGSPCVLFDLSVSTFVCQGGKWATQRWFDYETRREDNPTRFSTDDYQVITGWFFRPDYQPEQTDKDCGGSGDKQPCQYS